jgi:hypothetical protein
VPVDLFSYNSHIVNMPAYSTISKMLEDLSHQELQATFTHAQDPIKHGKLIFDNVQNYVRQHDAQNSQENPLNIGIAVTYIELDDIDPKAFDLKDKHQCPKENRHQAVTIDQLLGFIDNNHIDTVGTLQWLRALINHIPKLHKCKWEVSMLYCTKYTAYLLEMICNLKLESSPELCEAELCGLLVNLSGKAGAFTNGDTLQEFFNRLLKVVIDCKGAEFGDN